MPPKQRLPRKEIASRLLCLPGDLLVRRDALSGWVGTGVVLAAAREWDSARPRLRCSIYGMDRTGGARRGDGGVTSSPFRGSVGLIPGELTALMAETGPWHMLEAAK